MAKLPSRFRRLDQILADLPVDDPMLLTELDGYLACIAVYPEPIPAEEWLPPIWGGAYGEGAPFENPIDVRLFADMVVARRDEILRDLLRGKFQPIFDVDERNGEPIWEDWIQGFAMAMDLRPQMWGGRAGAEDEDAAAAVDGVRALIDVASDRSSLTADEINAICDAAPSMIPSLIKTLSAFRALAPARPAENAVSKVGRNDRCPCGSGKKHKHCCGSN